MSENPSDRPEPSTPQPEAPVPPAQPPAAEEVTPDAPATPQEESDKPKRKILIGSQRDPAAYRPKPRHDHIPVVGGIAEPEPEEAKAEPSDEIPVPEVLPKTSTETPAAAPASLAKAVEATTESPAHVPPPNIRAQLSPDLEKELEDALGSESIEDLIAGTDAVTKQAALEPEEKYPGRVVMIRREDVFVELGGREQGIVPLKQFDEAPEVGLELEVVVSKFNSDDGIYELTLPMAAAHVSDWGDLSEGMIVNAQITGHNSGGLECEVNHIRGFIPISQISLYRVEDLAQFVDEKFTCLVTEADPNRRNLVLSRRAMLEREREEARKELMESLAPGQVHEGTVRKLMDFGAFVDLGGVDGLLHISQLAWNRVEHPSDVLSEGQIIKVRVEKVDAETGRISLAYRDMMESPWINVTSKYPTNMPVRGKVVKIMEFGAFVELEPGVEGLVHISELAHKRVFRVSDVVKEGEEIEVLVQSVDTAAQRISLSMKGLIAAPASAKKGDKDAEPEAIEMKKYPDRPLKGGTGGAAGGEQFGLKW